MGKLVLLYLEEVAFHSIFGDTTLFPPFTDRIDNIVCGLFPYIKENISVMFGAEKSFTRRKQFVILYDFLIQAIDAEKECFV